jgi:hypothetical protein
MPHETTQVFIRWEKDLLGDMHVIMTLMDDDYVGYSTQHFTVTHEGEFHYPAQKIMRTLITALTEYRIKHR